MKSELNSLVTVLVAEDEEMVRRVMCKILESDGYRVLAASTGSDALMLCRNAEPPVDLLVTDYGLPDMTGVELSYECRSLNRELSILYVSGSMPGEDLRADLATGRHGFLAKPFRQADLLGRVKDVLAKEPVATQARQNQGSRVERLRMER